MYRKFSKIAILFSFMVISTLCQANYLYDNSGSLDNTIGYTGNDGNSYDNSNDNSGYYDMNATDFGNYNSDGYIYDYNNSDYPVIDNSTDPGIYYSVPTTQDPSQYPSTTGMQPTPTNSIQDQGTILTTTPPTNTVVPTYLKGNYIMQPYGTNLPAVPSTFDEKGITFTGCNQISVPYSARSNGNFKANSYMSQTQKSCSKNYDNDFIQSLFQANNFQKSAKGFSLTFGGKKIFQCQGPIMKVAQPMNYQGNLQKQPTYSFINSIPQGNFKFSIPGTTLSPITSLLGTKGLHFTGCNNIAVLCSSSSQGAFTPGNVVTGSQKQCANNNDQGYLQAILGGDSFVRQGNNFYITKRGSKIADFQYMGMPQSTSTSFAVSSPIIFPAPLTVQIRGVTIGSSIPIPTANFQPPVLPSIFSMAGASTISPFINFKN